MFTSMPNPDLYEPLARIVDDEETVRNSEAFMLRMGGINAVAYESAEEGRSETPRMPRARRAHAGHERA